MDRANRLEVFVPNREFTSNHDPPSTVAYNTHHQVGSRHDVISSAHTPATKNAHVHPVEPRNSSRSLPAVTKPNRQLDGGESAVRDDRVHSIPAHSGSGVFARVPRAGESWRLGKGPGAPCQGTRKAQVRECGESGRHVGVVNAGWWTRASTVILQGRRG